jgi:alpha-tubulin suppressor-like RCC1 family protein
MIRIFGRSAPIAALVIVAGCLAATGVQAEVSAQRLPGRSLTVAVDGLPTGTAATVRVKGPKGFKRSVRLSSTKRLKKLRPGKYRLTARPVTAGGEYVARDAVKTVRVRKTRGVRVLFAYRSVGAPPTAPPTVDTTSPGQVTGLEVAQRTATTLRLTWTNPADADLDRIVVRRAEGATAPGTATSGVGVPVDGTATQVLDANLTPRTDYSYAVFALDRAGNTSAAASVSSSTLIVGAVSAGSNHSCVINGRGRVYCWGSGYLGDGTNALSLSPVAVDTDGVLKDKVIADVGVGNSTCVLDLDGRAYCWGRGTEGQLGNGGNVDQAKPVAVDSSGALANKVLVDVAVGSDFACALDDQGRAYCWGRGTEGQLGNGGTGISNVPLPVTAGPEPFVSISALRRHACAVDTDGRAYCWGRGLEGQIGDGAAANRTAPTPVSVGGVLAGKRIAHVAAGGNHSCAVDTDGKAYCWGRGTSGELGTGFTTNSNDPVSVNPFSAAGQAVLTGIATGGNHSCAVARSGRLLCWGFSGNGQVGDGTRTTALSPVILATGFFADKQAIAADVGDFHSCGMDGSGHVACWGFAAFVGTGSSNASDALSPLAILGIPD